MATMKLIVSFIMTLLMAVNVLGRASDPCVRQPTISGLCVSSTMGIYYDAETQRCKYLGCSPDKKLFATLQDCEKICNNSRHTRRRVRQYTKT